MDIQNMNVLPIIIEGLIFAGADWSQKASAAIGFITATQTLWKQPHITLKKPLFH
jgi:hypothetical protein